MKNATYHSAKVLAKFVILVCLIGIIALITSMAVSSAPQAGNAAKLEIKEELIPKAVDMQKMDPVYIRAKVINLAVQVEDDHYTCKAALSVLNTDEVGGQWMVATIPGARVQRVFELAMEMKDNTESVNYEKSHTIDAWGYKTPAPEGSEAMDAVFYTIVEAKVWDDDLAAVVLLPWMREMF